VRREQESAQAMRAMRRAGTSFHEGEIRGA
jgi:hypothetical protein